MWAKMTHSNVSSVAANFSVEQLAGCPAPHGVGFDDNGEHDIQSCTQRTSPPHGLATLGRRRRGRRFLFPARRRQLRFVRALSLLESGADPVEVSDALGEAGAVGAPALGEAGLAVLGRSAALEHQRHAAVYVAAGS